MTEISRTIEKEEDRYGGYDSPVVPGSVSDSEKASVRKPGTVLAPQPEKREELNIRKNTNTFEIIGRVRTPDFSATHVTHVEEANEFDEVYYDRREKKLPFKIKALLFGYLFMVVAIVAGVIGIGAAATAIETTRANLDEEPAQYLVTESTESSFDFVEYKF